MTVWRRTTSWRDIACRSTIRNEIHIDRGIGDATLRQGIRPHDIIVFGAMLAQPRPTDPDWDATRGRLLTTYGRIRQQRVARLWLSGSADRPVNALSTRRGRSERSMF